jgi:hypothetical protein
MRRRRGDRARRKATNRGNRVCVEKVNRVTSYRTGIVERSFDNAYGGTEKRMVLTVIDAESETLSKRAGKRKHKQAQTLNHNRSWSVPRFATKILPRKCTTKAKAPRQSRGFTVTIGEDGCANVSVRGHLFVHGYTAKNKHSVDAPDINSGMFDSGAKVVNNNDFQLVKVTLEKQGRTKFHTATAIVWNPDSKMHKRIVLPRVRNKKEAIVALRTIHQIEC